MAIIDGGPPDDNLIGTPEADLIRGFAGDDSLFGRAGNDTLDGGTGNDALFGEAGNDVLDGGDGSDTAYYSAAAAVTGAVTGVTVKLSTNNFDRGFATGGDGKDILSNIEGVIGSSFNDSLTGNAGDNGLVGEAGSDTK